MASAATLSAGARSACSALRDKALSKATARAAVLWFGPVLQVFIGEVLTQLRVLQGSLGPSGSRQIPLPTATHWMNPLMLQSLHTYNNPTGCR